MSKHDAEPHDREQVSDEESEAAFTVRDLRGQSRHFPAAQHASARLGSAPPTRSDAGAFSGHCSCGVVAVATCARCGQPRCTNHYIVEARQSLLHGIMRDFSWSKFDVTYPHGVFTIELPNLDEAERKIFIELNPACIDCRVTHAQQWQDTYRAEQDAAVTSPSAETVARAASLAKGGYGYIGAARANYTERVLAAIAARLSATSNLEVIDVRFECAATKQRFRTGELETSVQVTARTPAIRLSASHRHLVVTADGEVLHPSMQSTRGATPVQYDLTTTGSDTVTERLVTAVGAAPTFELVLTVGSFADARRYWRCTTGNRVEDYSRYSQDIGLHGLLAAASELFID